MEIAFNILSWFYNETNTCNELHYYAVTDLHVQKRFSQMLNKYGYWNLITLDVYRKQVGEILSIFYNIVKKKTTRKILTFAAM